MTERMGVLSSDGRCLQPSPLAARAMLRPAARRLAAVGIGFAGGWAVLYGALMPFGLGLTLGLAEDCFAPCAAGAALGLLLHGLGALSLRSLCQLCALGAAVAARWLLPQKFMPAALAGCGTLTGMALCFALGSSGADLLLYSAADALLAAAIGFGLRKFAPERPGMGTLLVGAAVAAALGSVRWGWFSPGVLACAAAELALCCRAQKFAALSGSAVLGAALCAADPALATAAAGLGCATAAAAVLAPGRRVETLAAYAGGCVSGVLCVQPPGNAFGLLFSACGGMAVVCLLPGGWLAPAADTPQSGENAPAPARSAAASTRLEAVAQSLSSLAETVNAVYEGLPRRREGFRWVIDNVHDTLCFNCGRRETCWKQEYTATMAGMEALRPLLEQNGSVEAAQLPGQLSRCIHPAALCAAAGRSFALYRSRKEARIHSEAMRTALTEQYSAVAEALGVLSEQLGRPGDPEPYKSSRVAEFFTGLGAPPQECAVTLDDLGRTHAAVTLPRTRFTPQELAARLVNVALALKSEDESGATLDLISVDLYTGTARLFKAGAAPGFLVHGGRVRAVGEATLPMGVLGGVNGQSRVVHLTAGDYAVLVSDGLLVDGAGWVAKQVELSAAAGDAPEKLAETLVQTARIRAQKTGRPDDITAAVLRLEKSG